jgi:hypothetical protein
MNDKLIYNSKYLTQAPTSKQEEKLSYLYTRGAHGLLKEGAPCVIEWAAKWGSKGATSLQSTPTSVNQMEEQGGGATSLYHRLPPTRGRHLSKRGAPPLSHVLKSSVISNQSQSNQVDMVPFDLLTEFAFKFAPLLSPFILFLFSLG